jgi:hypothetical protein
VVVTAAYCSDMRCGAAFEVGAADYESLANATCKYCGAFLQEGPDIGREGRRLGVGRTIEPGEVVVETVMRPMRGTN